MVRLADGDSLRVYTFLETEPLDRCVVDHVPPILLQDGELYIKCLVWHKKSMIISLSLKNGMSRLQLDKVFNIYSQIFDNLFSVYSQSL